MDAALEFLETLFTFKDGGWTMFTIMVGGTCWMLFYYIHHWVFRIAGIPIIALSAAGCHYAMNEYALHVTSDTVVNYAVGFGSGIFAAMMVMSTIAWLYYEAATE
jgi:hypothetical protein